MRTEKVINHKTKEDTMYIRKAILACTLMGGLAFAAAPAFAGDSSANSGSTAVAKTSSTATASEANKQSITENYAASKIPQQAPEIVVAPSNTTAPCVVSGGAGVSFAGGAVGLSGGIKDKGCETRARVELLRSLGFTKAALAYLCDADVEVRKAFVNIGESCYPLADTAIAPTRKTN